jgi:acetylglutamate kinase
MQQAIEKARTLVEALTYIQQYSGKIVVIKFGGSVMDSPEAMRGILTDVVFMNSVGMKPVLIHGGGKAISQAMSDRGLEVQFVQGRRYTDKRTLTVAEHVLCNEINNNIVETIQSLGPRAMGLHTLSSAVLSGERLYLEESGRKIDLGMVGKVTSVNARLIELLCQAGTIPVIAPLAMDDTGQKLNCNADTAAGEVARALQAEKFVVVSDTHGIRRNVEDPASMIPKITEAQIRELISLGIISAGMLPKVEACLGALDAGVKRAHIIDGRFTHSLLLEIFSDKGIGTLITKGPEA